MPGFSSRPSTTGGGSTYDDTAVLASISSIQSITGSIPTIANIPVGTYSAVSTANADISLFTSSLFANGKIWNVSGQVLMYNAGAGYGVVGFSGNWIKIAGSITRLGSTIINSTPTSNQPLQVETVLVYGYPTADTQNCMIRVVNINGNLVTADIGVFAELKFLN